MVFGSSHIQPLCIAVAVSVLHIPMSVLALDCDFELCAKTGDGYGSHVNTVVQSLGPFATYAGMDVGATPGGACNLYGREANKDLYLQVGNVDHQDDLSWFPIKYLPDPTCAVKKIEICTYWLRNKSIKRTFQGTAPSGSVIYPSHVVPPGNAIQVISEEGQPITVMTADGEVLGVVSTEGVECGGNEIVVNTSTILPVPPPPAAPDADSGSSNTSSATTTVASLSGCYLVNFETATETLLATGSVTKFDIINFDQVVSVRCDVCGDVDEVEFLWDGDSYIDRDAAYWMSGDEGNVHSVVSIIKCGKKTEVDVVGRAGDKDVFGDQFTLEGVCIFA